MKEEGINEVDQNIKVIICHIISPQYDPEAFSYILIYNRAMNL